MCYREVILILIIYQIFKNVFKRLVFYIKDVNLESIDYYRIQIVHKTTDNKHKMRVHDSMEIWAKGIYRSY